MMLIGRGPRWFAACVLVAATLASGCGGRSFLRVTVDSDDRPALARLFVTVSVGGADSLPAELLSLPQGQPVVFALELDEARTGEATVSVTATLGDGATRSATGRATIVARGVAEVSVWIGRSPPSSDGGSGADGGTDGGPDPQHCADVKVSGDETDVDCGGARCVPCANGRSCRRDADCRSGRCTASRCAGFEPVGPWGGDVTALAVDPFDAATLLAGTGSDLYRSGDGGKSWRHLDFDGSSDQLLGIAFDPATPGTVWLRTATEVRVSRDRGDTVKPSSPKVPVLGIDYPPVVPIALAPASPLPVLFVGTDVGVVIAADQMTSTVALDGKKVLSLAVDPTNPRRVWAGTDADGVFRTEDAGKTWRLEPGLLTGQEPKVLGLAASGGSPYSLWAATTAGLYLWEEPMAAWRKVELPDAGPWPRSVVLDPNDRRRVLVACSDLRAYRREPNGDWRDISSGLGAAGDLMPLATSPAGASAVYLGTGAGTFRMDIAGDGPWQPARLGLDGWQLLSLALDPNDPRRAFAVVRSSVGTSSWQTTDDAATWTPIVVAAEPTAVATSNHGGMTWLHLADRTPDGDVRVRTSLDGGAKWDPPVALRVNGYVFGLFSDPGNADALYAVEGDSSSQGIFRSDDGGRTFVADTTNLPSMAPDGLPHCGVRTMVFAGPGVAYAATACGVVRHSPGGGWIDVTGMGKDALPNRDVTALSVSAPGGFLLAAASVAVYTGRGANGPNPAWESLGALGGINGLFALAAHPSDQNIIWAGSTSGVHYTSTGGVGGAAAWTAQRLGTEVFLLAVDRARPTMVYAGTASRALWRNPQGAL